MCNQTKPEECTWVYKNRLDQQLLTEIKGEAATNVKYESSCFNWPLNTDCVSMKSLVNMDPGVCRACTP